MKGTAQTPKPHGKTPAPSLPSLNETERVGEASVSYGWSHCAGYKGGDSVDGAAVDEGSIPSVPQ